MPTRALPMPPWVRTIAPETPTGGSTTDAAQKDTATPQAQDRESETPSDNNSGDDEGDPEPADESAGDVAAWKKHARTWETRAKENKKPPIASKPSVFSAYAEVAPSRVILSYTKTRMPLYGACGLKNGLALGLSRHSR